MVLDGMTWYQIGFDGSRRDQMGSDDKMILNGIKYHLIEFNVIYGYFIVTLLNLI